MTRVFIGVCALFWRHGAPANRGQRGSRYLQVDLLQVDLWWYLKDHPSGCKWLGSLPCTSREVRPFVSGSRNPTLKVDENYPWLFTTYKSWDDLPSEGYYQLITLYWFESTPNIPPVPLIGWKMYVFPTLHDLPRFWGLPADHQAHLEIDIGRGTFRLKILLLRTNSGGTNARSKG